MAQGVLPNALSVLEARTIWYAVHTRSRHERMVGQCLTDKGIPVFSPERLAWSRRRDRRKLISVPLFPGYLFVSPESGARQFHDVVCTHGVVRILGVNGRPLPVPRREMESLRILVESGELLRPVPYFPPGSRVRVLEGPLAGAEGAILRRRGKRRLVVSIEMMQRAVAVELAEYQLEELPRR